MNGPSDEDSARLREAPVGRFAGESHEFDLHARLEALRAEPHPGVRGHRQVTIFHRKPVAHVLFAFESGGHLDRHLAAGLVTIHVLEGRLIVEADGAEHELGAGHVLVLNPSVPHAVRAPERGAMLLTVVMEEAR
jgi:quercetin dioxygenase-like cupin family protein